MILLPGLLFILWGDPGLCLEEDGGFTFDGDLRHFAVATNSVYIATEEKLYQLSHDLTLVHSLTQRGVLTGNQWANNVHFSRVSEPDQGNATFRVNILLPLVESKTLISCGVIECGYCEVLDPKNISNVRYSEHLQVGSLWRHSASVGFLVDVDEGPTETYILAAVQQNTSRETSCQTGSYTVTLHNTNDKQTGGIFSIVGKSGTISIKRRPPVTTLLDVEFVDGFQIDLIIYLFSNLPKSDKSNRVRLIWLEGKTSKAQTLRSLRGSTLSVSGDGRGKLITSAVIRGGPSVLWSGVFSVDGGQTNTELVLFDISPDLSGGTDVDPDFCSGCKPPSMVRK